MASVVKHLKIAMVTYRRVRTHRPDTCIGGPCDSSVSEGQCPHSPHSRADWSIPG